MRSSLGLTSSTRFHHGPSFTCLPPSRWKWTLLIGVYGQLASTHPLNPWEAQVAQQRAGLHSTPLLLPIFALPSFSNSFVLAQIAQMSRSMTIWSSIPKAISLITVLWIIPVEFHSLVLRRERWPFWAKNTLMFPFSYSRGTVFSSTMCVFINLECRVLSDLILRFRSWCSFRHTKKCLLKSWYIFLVTFNYLSEPYTPLAISEKQIQEVWDP